ncbi:MAG: hypothetical protein U1D55_10610 [Phycisphaerae bacterium]
MPESRSNPEPRVPTVRLVERLYVLWIVGTLLLVCVILMVMVTLRSAIVRQTQTIDQLSTRLVDVERRVGEMSRDARVERHAPDTTTTRTADKLRPPPTPAGGESPARSTPDRATPPVTPATAPALPAQIEPPTSEKDRAPSTNVTSGEKQQAALGAAAAPTPAAGESAGGPVANRLIRIGDDGPELVAPETAAGLVDQVAGASTTQLPADVAAAAIAARLLDRSELAESLAARAAAIGASLASYDEASAKRLLDAGDVTACRPYAERLAASGSLGGRVLLASVYLRQGQAASADEALGDVGDLSRVAAGDLIRLGRLCVELERARELRAAVTRLDAVSEPLRAQRDYLRAVVSVLDGHYVEAVAALDFLLDASPNDYWLRTWRGVALLSAQKFDAARAGLSHAERFADRPEASYWLAILEIRCGQADAGEGRLRRLVSAIPRYAPAWEALATQAFNRGDLADAERCVTTAIQARPRRASAEFLLALVYCRQLRKQDAAAALQRAFRLDPGLLESARAAEIVTRIFDASELEVLAGSTATRPT